MFSFFFYSHAWKKKKLKFQKLARKETREKKKDPLNFMHIQITFFNLKLSIGFGREWALRVSFKQSLFFFDQKIININICTAGWQNREEAIRCTHTLTQTKGKRGKICPWQTQTVTDWDRRESKLNVKKKYTKHAVTCRWDSSIE